MRYTASAAMEDRTLRDVERWKDKIEIRLDNRQVFFLFFGSALIACLLFILGVVVGKRLESRGRAAAPEIEDPLALLDRIAASPGTVDESITFPRTLTQAPAVRPEKKVAKPTEPKVAVVPPAEVPTAVVQPSEKPAAPSKPIVETVAVAKKPEVRAATEPKPNTVPSNAAAKFSLQLGSFQSKEEADSFMSEFTSAAPFVVTSDIPGKGRWFRVRVGKFATSEEAVKAKAEFERQHQKIAYIAPL